MFVSIQKAAKILGVCIATVRNWEKLGLIKPAFRTSGGHRRYSENEIKTFIAEKNEAPISKITICYSRVSSHDQRDDLARQASSLLAYCQKQNFENIESITDLGSGLNMKKPGLKKLIRLILDGKVERLILSHKDRLLRFGAELIFQVCRFFNIEVVVLEEDIPASFEEELSRDVVTIITVFTAKLYGRRSHQKRKQRQLLEAAA